MVTFLNLNYVIVRHAKEDTQPQHSSFHHNKIIALRHFKISSRHLKRNSSFAQIFRLQAGL